MNTIIEVRYSDLEQEREACQTLLELSERENNLHGIAFAHTYFGDYYIALNDSTQCGYHLQMAIPICLDNAFTDLLLRIYNLYGICYESLSDEQTALQYYLMALNLAEKNHNPAIESILYNNIANNFELFKDYEEAEKYYSRACSFFEELPLTLPNQKYICLRIWGNLAEVYRALGRLEDMASYLNLCEALTGDDIRYTKALVLCRGWCGYYTDTKDVQKAEAYARRLLDCIAAEPQADKFMSCEMLIGICGTMISAGCASISKDILSCILSMLNNEEADRLQRIQKLKTHYCEVFGTEAERNEAYREYYRIMNGIDENLNQVRALGLRNIIYLDTLKNNLVSEKDSLNEEAHLDELTKLYNRRHFNKSISKAFSDPGVLRMGFIMIDIDYFKEYNDTYGHAAGDTVLKTVAGILTEHAPAEILCSRYGGDEMACLCINISDDKIEKFIKSVQTSLSRLCIEHVNSRCTPFVTLSIGYSSSLRADIEAADLLFDKADQALYASKNSGRNAYTKA